jgi:hypothetical protein
VRPNAAAKNEKVPEVDLVVVVDVVHHRPQLGPGDSPNCRHDGPGAHQFRLAVRQRHLHVVRTDVPPASSTGTWSSPVEANRTRASST